MSGYSEGGKLAATLSLSWRPDLDPLGRTALETDTLATPQIIMNERNTVNMEIMESKRIVFA